jgi:predicted DNA-binding ribbon-helix-helix protein
MRSFSFVKLPASRAAQLKALAKLRNTTMTELIAEIVNQAISAGELPDQTPGVKFED